MLANSRIITGRVFMDFILRHKLLLAVSFVFLTALSAQVVIAVEPVPFTLQTLAVLCSGAILGARRGMYTQLAYLSLGVLGLPFFAPIADVSVGLLKVLGPTGGYLLAFPLGAYVTGKIVEKSTSVYSLFAAFAIGEFLIIAFGVMYLNVIFLHNLTQSLLVGGTLFSVWTLLKVVLGVGVASAYRKFNN